MNSKHDVLILSLDALIGGGGKILTPSENTPKKADRIVIPDFFIDELIKYKEKSEPFSFKRESSDYILHSLREMKQDLHVNGGAYYTAKNGMEIEIFCSSSMAENSKSATIDAALNYKHNTRKNVAIYTGDDGLGLKALMADIDIAAINDGSYNGRRSIKLSGAALDTWLEKKSFSPDEFINFFPEENTPKPFEFFEFIFDGVFYGIHPNNIEPYIGCYYPKEGEIMRLKHAFSEAPRGITPKSSGQAMLLEGCLLPPDEAPIVVCQSPFGTGKTFISTAFAIHAMEQHLYDYERVLIVPRETSLGREIGFLPGDEKTKIMPQAIALFDNSCEYFKIRRDKRKGGEIESIKEILKKTNRFIDEYFQFTSLNNMGGRSINNSIYYLDEAQDLERGQMNQLLKRLGVGSKMIVTGDPHQVFNKHMNAHSNGLAYAATHLADSEYAVVISMFPNEIVRSAAALDIARRFDT